MLSPNKDRLELALKASNEGIWKWDLLEDKIHYSKLLLKFLGSYAEEPLPHLFKDIETIYHKDDQA